jgi:hypothetical protein
MKDPDLMQQVRTALAEAPAEARYAFEKLAFELTRFRSLLEIVKKIQQGNGGIFTSAAPDASGPYFRERTAEEEMELHRSIRLSPPPDLPVPSYAAK